MSTPKFVRGTDENKLKTSVPTTELQFYIQIKGFANTKPDVLRNRLCKIKGKVIP